MKAIRDRRGRGGQQVGELAPADGLGDAALVAGPVVEAPGRGRGRDGVVVVPALEAREHEERGAGDVALLVRFRPLDDRPESRESHRVVADFDEPDGRDQAQPVGPEGGLAVLHLREMVEGVIPNLVHGVGGAARPHARMDGVQVDVD
ncbi:MAG: hypothetical protein UY92_C0007G0029 [Candidatus Magasanikbacteria bacterium GW2011_GWA2_56_11]|uniref:Uncharacterized protein n=1 Tax=Candidatus Magasanikbacteria bacterium GW2011_GWA2_56_11 TaxID=1619044 RepID=A0A0G1YGP4_9BACT|nr:MAG: hypothetical protein UY92_C0007G0029 [Candidatus Magasanikbacteria bacterium GW2011_GWA2_56_11]